MTNRPIDYEHRFARLVPNDIVTPTTEVVKKEEGHSICLGPSEMTLGDYTLKGVSQGDEVVVFNNPVHIGIDTGEEQSYSITVTYDPATGRIVDCDIKEKEPEQEHQTGWRFLGGAEQSSYVINDCAGTFTIGKIYQIEHTGLTDPTFIDDNNEIMHEELKYFEEVK